MLTAAALGLAGYGFYAIVVAMVDLLGRSTLEIWANVVKLLLGIVLLLSAAFVRVVVPGGLPLAVGALLGLQALALHSAAHLEGEVHLGPQLARAGFAAVLVGLAYLGSRGQKPLL